MTKVFEGELKDFSNTSISFYRDTTNGEYKIEINNPTQVSVGNPSSPTSPNRYEYSFSTTPLRIDARIQNSKNLLTIYSDSLSNVKNTATFEKTVRGIRVAPYIIFSQTQGTNNLYLNIGVNDDRIQCSTNSFSFHPWLYAQTSSDVIQLFT